MTEEEAVLMREMITFTIDALESCREGYDHEGGSFQYYDEDKVKQTLAVLRNTIRTLRK